jgi:hypothetical protein
VGWSPSAVRLLVVIACRDLGGDLHGLNACPASERDLASYHAEVTDGEEDRPEDDGGASR